MSVERVSVGNASIADVLDRVLDKGIVIDAWIVVAASIATYLKKWGDLAQASTLADPARATTSPAHRELLKAARHRAAVAVNGPRDARPSSRTAIACRGRGAS